MASFVYNEAKRKWFNGTLDLDTDDIRVRLLMTNTTYDTENDGITNISDFTTDDIHDGANYVDKALGTETVTKTDASDRADFSADNVTWTALGAGTRAVAGALVYKFITNDAASFPIAWVEFSASPDGNDFVIRWNSGSSSGDILRLT
jgi:hypothetical protein